MTSLPGMHPQPYRAYTREFLNLVKLNSSKLPIPDWLKDLPRLPEEDILQHKTLILCWWYAFRQELFEMQFSATHALAYAELSSIWTKLPDEYNKMIGRGYKHLMSNMYLGYWILNTVFYYEHVLYYLCDRKRTGFERGDDWRGVLANLRNIACGVVSSDSIEKSETTALGKLVNLIENTDKVYLSKLRGFRDVRAHRYNPAIDAIRFPFSIRSGKSGHPVFEGPGRALRLESEKIFKMICPLWMRCIEVLVQLNTFKHLAIPRR